MKISARIATLELAEPFTISRGTTETADVVYVEIEHEGQRGYGEAVPIDRYDQTAESALAYIEEHGDKLGGDPWALEEIESRLPQEQFAARSGIDAALHDLQGKLPGSTPRSTISRGSSRASPSGACSVCAAPARRPPGRSGSATRTTWPGGLKLSETGSSA